MTTSPPLCSPCELLDVQEHKDMPTMIANKFNAMEHDVVAMLREHGCEIVPIDPLLSPL
jgi:hypothetical protein